MALVMMQGHVFDALVSPVSRADPLYLLPAADDLRLQATRKAVPEFRDRW